MIAIIAAILLPALLGFGVIALLLRDDRDIGLLERLGLSYPLGAGLLTVQMFLLGLLRIPFSAWSLSLPIVIEIAAIGLWAGYRGIPLSPPVSFGLFQELSSRGVRPLRKALLALLLAWASLKIGSVLLETSLRPIFAWDSWVNWSVGAKLFYYTGGLMLDVPMEDFFTRGAGSRMPSYPPHNPLMQAWMAFWIGSFDEALVKFWSTAYLPSAALLLYGAAARSLNRLTALALLVLFLSSRLMSYHATETYSDFPLGVTSLCALFAFVQAMRGSKQSWVLAGLLSGVSLFIKSDAPGFAGGLLLSALVFLWMNRREAPMLPSLAKLFIPLALAAPWFLFKSTHDLRLLQDYLQEVPLGWHAAEAIPRVINDVLSLQNFNLLLVALPVLLLVNGKPSRVLAHTAAVVLFAAMFYVAIYSVITHYYEVLMIGTVFFRNVLTYYPALCLTLALVIQEMAGRMPAPPAPAPAAAERSKKKGGKRR